MVSLRILVVADTAPDVRKAALPAEELARARAEVQNGSELESRQKELRSVEEVLDVQAFGFYKPKYDFESSAQYTARLKGIRDEHQTMIKDNLAAPCDTTWTVGGSVCEGKKMVKQQAELMLRALNARVRCGHCQSPLRQCSYDAEPHRKGIPGYQQAWRGSTRIHNAEAEEFRKSIAARQAGVVPEFVEAPPLEMLKMAE